LQVVKYLEAAALRIGDSEKSLSENQQRRDGKIQFADPCGLNLSVIMSKDFN
jgi:hypothetical protein